MTKEEAEAELYRRNHDIAARTATSIIHALTWGDIPDASIDAIRNLGRQKWSWIPGVGRMTLLDLDKLVRYWTDEEKMLLERTPL
jgi:hypothetical protein